MRYGIDSAEETSEKSHFIRNFFVNGDENDDQCSFNSNQKLQKSHKIASLILIINPCASQKEISHPSKKVLLGSTTEDSKRFFSGENEEIPKTVVDDVFEFQMMARVTSLMSTKLSGLKILFSVIGMMTTPPIDKRSKFNNLSQKLSRLCTQQEMHRRKMPKPSNLGFDPRSVDKHATQSPAFLNARVDLDDYVDSSPLRGITIISNDNNFNGHCYRHAIDFEEDQLKKEELASSCQNSSMNCCRLLAFNFVACQNSKLYLHHLTVNFKNCC